ncbi:hypothetical protein M011DRAFT_458846 [Sporormia fimetaria CBS 119925]|uniref:ATPase AAA-type core domain-containing protein n=1 Tax=Sporormia fimetaria CBS 119925 TaxID=1340428 RepID=A0A6A6VA83_9PLEO|nr:hypothetical protein M011DRAFT_458846 [Sporormia fimetaria CBS 119925]
MPFYIGSLYEKGRSYRSRGNGYSQDGDHDDKFIDAMTGGQGNWLRKLIGSARKTFKASTGLDFAYISNMYLMYYAGTECISFITNRFQYLVTSSITVRHDQNHEASQAVKFYLANLGGNSVEAPKMKVFGTHAELKAGQYGATGGDDSTRQVFTFGNRIFLAEMRTEIQEEYSDGYPSSTREEHLILRCFGRSDQPIRTLIEHCKASYGNRGTELKIKHLPARHAGQQDICVPKRPLDTIDMEPGLKADVNQTIESFFDPNTEVFFRSLGTPYRCGRGGGSAWDQCAIQKRRQDNPEMKQERREAIEKKVTLSGLLNVIDGAGAKEGRLLVMTTNAPKSLDKALYRRGRIDKIVHMEYCTKETSEMTFKRVFGNDPCRTHSMQTIDSLASAFKAQFPKKTNLEPAGLANYLMMHRGNPQKAVEDFPGFLHRRKTSEEQSEYDINDLITDQEDDLNQVEEPDEGVLEGMVSKLSPPANNSETLTPSTTGTAIARTSTTFGDGRDLAFREIAELSGASVKTCLGPTPQPQKHAHSGRRADSIQTYWSKFKFIKPQVRRAPVPEFDIDDLLSDDEEGTVETPTPPVAATTAALATTAVQTERPPPTGHFFTWDEENQKHFPHDGLRPVTPRPLEENSDASWEPTDQPGQQHDHPTMWNDGNREELTHNLETVMRDIRSRSPRWWSFLLWVCPPLAAVAGLMRPLWNPMKTPSMTVTAIPRRRMIPTRKKSCPRLTPM